MDYTYAGLPSTSYDNSQALTLVQSYPNQLQPYAPQPGPSSQSASGAASSTGSTRNVPAFLNKLYSMVNDPTTDPLIRWTESGLSFIVPSHEKFGRELLPRYFKHSNFGSFVRQLNMYGFHKVPHLQQGVLRLDGEEEKEKAEVLEFRHDNFQRGHQDLLVLIQRKKGAGGVSIDQSEFSLAADGKLPTVPGMTPHAIAKFQENLQQLLGEVAAVKRHQSLISSELRGLQATNQQLWQETLENRTKHEKNGDMIDKILKFLAGVFGGRVLGEGASAFTTGNIQAANTSSGLGLDSYGQSNGTTHGPSHNEGNATSANLSYNMVAGGRKRQRLLLKDSPRKEQPVQAASRSVVPEGAYFEELASDEDIPSRFSREGSAVQTVATDSPAEEPSSRFNELSATPQPPCRDASLPAFTGLPASSQTNAHAQLQQLSNGADSANSLQTLSNGDYGIDWAAISQILNDPSLAANATTSANANGIPSPLPNFSGYDFSDPNALLQSLGYAPGLPGQTTQQLALPAFNQDLSSLPTPANLPSQALAISPSSYMPNTSQQQVAQRYDAALDKAVNENNRLKDRMDSLSSAINKLVSQLPPGFDLSAFENSATQPSAAPPLPNGIDDFDFSQYLNAMTAEGPVIPGQHSDIDVNNAFAPYLTPDLADATAHASGEPVLSSPKLPLDQFSATSADHAPTEASELPAGTDIPKAEPPPTPQLLQDDTQQHPISALPAMQPEKLTSTRGRRPAGTGKGRGIKRAAEGPADVPKMPESELTASIPVVKEEAASPADLSAQRRSSRNKSKA